MKLTKLVIAILCFILIGEVLLRSTDYFRIMSGNRVQKIHVKLGESKEINLLKEKKIDLSEKSLRIMVIGDSYIHGGGIPPEEKFSNQLRNRINSSNTHYENFYVLDVSVPNSNNLDNTNTYFEYKEAFDPNIVILGYHFNDINGSLEKTAHVGKTALHNSGNQAKMKIRKITKFLYNSAVLKYFMPRLNNYLLEFGYIIPQSRLDKTLKNYVKNDESWQKSKELLKAMIQDIQNEGDKLIVYHFTYTNLIEYPNLFIDSGGSIQDFFSAFAGVTYISGIEQFRGKEAKKFFIFKHDGHPNALAHSLISEEVYQHIIDLTYYNNEEVISSVEKGLN